jgi:hypothetical protein
MPPTNEELNAAAERMRGATAELAANTEARRELGRSIRQAIARLAAEAIPLAERVALKLAAQALDQIDDWKP